MDNHLYYELAKEASQDMSWHPGIKKIIKYAERSPYILDVGCGEGTKLSAIASKKNRGFGIDINQFAIKQASDQYPQFSFTMYDGTSIPFPNEKFDLVYSTFVLEHTSDPDNFIREMIRVTKKGGFVVVLCPNYGSPNRRSPVSIDSPTSKLFSGLISDYFCTSNELNFKKVIPKKIFKKIDDDTTCEPYLLNLIRHVKNNHLAKIIDFSSLWEIDDNATSLHQSIFKKLGSRSLFPFKYWGPQLFIVLKK